MNIVGDHLASVARAATSPMEVDLYGRSAFNRYYYATYWAIRKHLSCNNWPDISHASIPDKLDALKEKMEKQRRKLLKTRVMTESDLNRTIIRAHNSIKELTRLLREGYKTRVIADYDPDTQVSITGTVIILNSIKISDAKHWSGHAASNAITLDTCLHRLGLTPI